MITLPLERASNVTASEIPDKEDEDTAQSGLQYVVNLQVAAPEVENPPGAVMAPVAPLVNIPELVTAMAPEPVEAKVLLTV